MDMENQCCCCLLRPLEKDLNTPYLYRGVIEKLSDMLEECFQIHFLSALNTEFGICEECASRLRDARDFKMQVQRSQAELQARLEKAVRLKEETVLEQLEKLEAEDNNIFQESFMLDGDAVKSEMSDNAASDGEFLPSEIETVAPSEPGLVSPRARQQLAMACSVRLERLRDDKAPHARHTRPRTSPHHKRLTTHMRVRAERDPDGTEPRDLASGRRAAADTYTCDKCGEQFARKSDIVTHLKTHVPNNVFNSEINTKKNTINKNSVLRTVVHGVIRYSCMLCSKYFKTRTKVERHLLSHTGDRPFGCDQCDKKYAHKCHLVRHKLVHTNPEKSKNILKKKTSNDCIKHTGKTPEQFTCGVCFAKLSSAWLLRRHNRIHTKETPFSCELCDKKFSRKYRLTAHLNTHTGRKGYTCAVCSKKCTTRGDLSEHMISTGHTADRFTCDLCKKQFARKILMYVHIRTHAEFRQYSCEICSKKFPSSYLLKLHKLMHTGNAPYSCDTCSKQFILKSHMEAHMGVHLGLRPYSCDICKRTFPSNSNLNRHKRIHLKCSLSRRQVRSSLAP